jgi:hypothetical protein
VSEVVSASVMSGESKSRRSASGSLASVSMRSGSRERQRGGRQRPCTPRKGDAVPLPASSVTAPREMPSVSPLRNARVNPRPAIVLARM